MRMFLLRVFFLILVSFFTLISAQSVSAQCFDGGTGISRLNQEEYCPGPGLPQIWRCSNNTFQKSQCATNTYCFYDDGGQRQADCRPQSFLLTPSPTPTDVPPPFASPTPDLSPTFPPLIENSSGLTDFTQNIGMCGNPGQVCCNPYTIGIIRLNEKLADSLPTPLDFIASKAIIPAINITIDGIGLNKTLPWVTGFFMNNVFKANVSRVCYTGGEAKTNLSTGVCTCEITTAAAFTRLCNQIKDTSEREQCNDCVSNGKGIYTGLGCLNLDVRTFIGDTVLGLGLNIAGIVALLCILYSAFRLQTSRGNPEQIKKAQELLTSCIMGLVLIIFSIFLLRLIGVNILKIPGFT